MQNWESCFVIIIIYVKIIFSSNNLQDQGNFVQFFSARELSYNKQGINTAVSLRRAQAASPIATWFWCRLLRPVPKTVPSEPGGSALAVASLQTAPTTCQSAAKPRRPCRLLPAKSRVGHRHLRRSWPTVKRWPAPVHPPKLLLLHHPAPAGTTVDSPKKANV